MARRNTPSMASHVWLLLKLPCRWIGHAATPQRAKRRGQRLVAGSPWCLGGTSAPNRGSPIGGGRPWGSGPATKRSRRQFDRSEREGRAGIPPPVPVFRECAGESLKEPWSVRGTSSRVGGFSLSTSLAVSAGALHGRPPLEGVGPHAVGPRGRLFPAR